MNKENPGSIHQPYRQLGRAFQFTRDDLVTNRKGQMSLSQQFGFNFLERTLYGWLLPLFKWVKSRKVIKATGKIRAKNYSRRVAKTFADASPITFEKRHIQFLTDDEDGLGFYVTEKQYNSLPQNIEMTLYYAPDENRIVSIEPPYAKD